MSQFNDCKHQALLTNLGKTEGHINDLELEWLQSLGATANQLTDAWNEYLWSEGYSGSVNDMQMSWLADMGYTQGTWNDRFLAFWCDGGVVSCDQELVPATQDGITFGYLRGSYGLLSPGSWEGVNIDEFLAIESGETNGDDVWITFAGKVKVNGIDAIQVNIDGVSAVLGWDAAGERYYVNDPALASKITVDNAPTLCVRMKEELPATDATYCYEGYGTQNVYWNAGAPPVLAATTIEFDMYLMEFNDNFRLFAMWGNDAQSTAASQTFQWAVFIRAEDLIGFRMVDDLNTTQNFFHSTKPTLHNWTHVRIDYDPGAVGSEITITIDGVAETFKFSNAKLNHFDGFIYALGGATRSFLDRAQMKNLKVVQDGVTIIDAKMEELYGTRSINTGTGDHGIINDEIVHQPMSANVTALLQLPQSDATGRYDMALWENGSTTVQNVTDFEGVIREIPAGVMPLEGGRVEYNIVHYSADIYAADNAAPGVGQVQATINPNGGIDFNADLSARVESPQYSEISEDYVYEGRTFGVWVEISGTPGDRVNLCITGYTSWAAACKTITLSATPTRYYVERTFTSADRYPFFRLINNITDTAKTFTIHKWGLYERTGSDVGKPPEFIETGDDTDKAKKIAYYATENGNTINPDGTVNEATGPAITPQPVWRHEPASTNYADGDNDLSGGPETVDLTTPGTGDYTLSVYGTAAVTVAAGTAVGTGFGQATDGNPVTFNLTTAGTVTLTLDSGTLDKMNGQAMKQVEKHPFATSWIETSGAPATRYIAQMRHPYDPAYFNQDEGMLLFRARLDFQQLAELRGMLTIDGQPTGLLYGHSAIPDTYSTYDGTNVSYAAVPTLTEGDEISFAVRWNSTLGELQFGSRNVTDNSAWAWDTVSAYAGSFPQSGPFELFKSLQKRVALVDCYVADADMGTSWIEENF